MSYCFHHCSLFHHGGDTYWKRLSAWLLKFSLCSWLQMLNRLTKSAEMQARVDEEYFNINMEGHQMRLKWENTLKNCYQVEKIVSYLSFCGHLAVPLIKSGSLWDNGAQWRSQEFFISVKDFTSDWFQETLKAQLISQDSMFCILSTKTRRESSWEPLGNYVLMPKCWGSSRTPSTVSSEWGHKHYWATLWLRLDRPVISGFNFASWCNLLLTVVMSFCSQWIMQHTFQ